MIGTLDIKVNAAHPNMPLTPFYAHIGSPSQVRVINVPKAIGKWKITSVAVTANYPDNTSQSKICVLDGGCWHATLPASTEVGKSLNGFKVTADGVSEDGETTITGYVLGKGDLFILDDDSTVTIGGKTIYVHIVKEKLANAHEGDLYDNNGRWEIYNGTEWVSLSGTGDVKHSDFEDIAYDLDPEESTLADTMNKLNLVIKRLREGIVPALALLFSLSVFADYPGTVDVQKAKLSTLPGKAMVVTNVVNALPFPNDTVAPGLILSKSTNGVEWIVNPGGGGSLGPIAYITGKTGDISNKNFRVIAEKNPAGQIVASIEQVQFDPEMKTVEEEEARAFQKEMTLNYMITNEVARATGVELDLDEKIRSLSSLGRFISTWNTATGRPGTEPKTTYLEYKGGDYYLVTAVSTNGAPNYIPNGTVYTNGTASAAVAPDTVNFNDIYRHADDGTWIHVPMAGVQTTFEQIAGEPTNNVKLAAALADGRMTGERATNIAESVVHQFVDDDYLATPSVTNGLRHVMNMDAYTFTPGEWTKTNTDATVTVSGVEVPAYTSLAWNGSKWTCYDSAAEATVDMLGSLEDPNAYTLGFPNGEITERPPVLTAYSRLATTNDLFALEGDIISLLAAETNRAYTAETNLAAQIVAEHDRAYAAETNIVAELVAETNRAQVAEAAIVTDLVAETNRAQLAEAAIEADLVTETNRAQVAEAAIRADLVAETNRAQTAEAAITAELVAETNRAQIAEAVIRSDLVAETNRAQMAEAAISSELVAETNRAQTAEAAIDTRLVAETNRAQTAESALDAKIVAETNRAQLAEASILTDLTAEIVAETNRAQTAEASIRSDLTEAIVAETNRAQLAEAALDTRLIAETNRAQIAEADIRGESAALEARLVAETNRAQLAEADLGTRIDDEDARAQTAEQALDAKITAETNRAQVAEAAISASLAAEVTRATGAESALDAKITSETNRAQVAEAAIRTDLAAEVTRATGAESGLDTRLVAETNRSITVDNALRADLNAEISRAIAAENLNYDLITNETTRAKIAEATKIPLMQKGATNGVAILNFNGLVPDAELPSHVKNYEMYANMAALPMPGRTDCIYLTSDDNSMYRYTYDTDYVKIGGGGGGGASVTNYNELINRPIIEGNIVTGGLNLAAADLNLMTNLKHTASENGKVLGVKNNAISWVTPSQSDHISDSEGNMIYANKQHYFIRTEFGPWTKTEVTEFSTERTGINKYILQDWNGFRWQCHKYYIEGSTTEDLGLMNMVGRYLDSEATELIFPDAGITLTTRTKTDRTVTDVLATVDDIYDLTDGVLWTNDVVDALSSTETSVPLSANQGRVLNANKQDKLPDAVKDKFLHANKTTGDLEWADLNISTNGFITTNDVVDALNSTSNTNPLSANQGRVLNAKFTNGSVTKVGTSTVGGTLNPIYLNAGTPTAGTQLYARKATVNGTEYTGLIRSINADIQGIFAPNSGGTAGQLLTAMGTNKTPEWRNVITSLSTTKLDSVDESTTLSDSALNYTLLLVCTYNAASTAEYNYHIIPTADLANSRRYILVSNSSRQIMIIASNVAASSSTKFTVSNVSNMTIYKIYGLFKKN